MKYRMNGKLRTSIGNIVHELIVFLIKTRPKALQDQISEKYLLQVVPTVTSLPKLEYQNKI